MFQGQELVDDRNLEQEGLSANAEVATGTALERDGFAILTENGAVGQWKIWRRASGKYVNK